MTVLERQAVSRPGASPARSVAAPPRRRRVRLGTGAIGWVAFEVAPGDGVAVTDPEGMQPGMLIVEGEGGEPAFEELLGEDIEVPVALADAPPGARVAWHAAPGIARAVLARDGEAGRRITLTARRAARCLLLAPGAAMSPDAQDPPTPLLVELDVAVGTAPPPLAAPKFDLRVDAATARAYRVAAGDYIQIIDVDGRQCSDFLAFDAAALAAGREFGIDPTATRTLMGTASPGPGLHAKYFDQRLRPLVELVRDTVGRHDTFMLACTARYYDDMGYPGHANCTDNFNAALAPHGVAPRDGWPAVNFFYNTRVGADDAITMDEPWSRPGDHVLLRALTDLVCASSSCADDIDPANAWEPTDIHVRIYDKSEDFSRGIAHRMTPDSAPLLTRQSGFHPRTSALTRAFTEYRGFWLPTEFTDAGPLAEYWACRERVAVIDLSALRKFEITGPDSEALLQLATTRDIRRLAVGQVVYTALCHPHGGMMDDGTVFRLGPQNFRLVCGDEYCGALLRGLAAECGMQAWVRSSTDQLHNIAVQGPRARELLAPLVATPPHRPSVAELKWFRLTVGRVGGLQGPAVLVSRTGYTGELGYEIWCHPDAAPVVWDAVWSAGQPLGLRPMGLHALDMLRIEAGLVFAGYEFCDQIDPFEAGIGFAVASGKADPFIGSDALARRSAHPQRQLVGLDVDGAEAVGHGDPIFSGRATLGVVTSATRSPILGRTVALARLDVAGAEVGTRVEIGKLDGHQKRIAATVVQFPHFDPGKTRVRA